MPSCTFFFLNHFPDPLDFFFLSQMVFTAPFSSSTYKNRWRIGMVWIMWRYTYVWEDANDVIPWKSSVLTEYLQRAHLLTSYVHVMTGHTWYQCSHVHTLESLQKGVNAASARYGVCQFWKVPSSIQQIPTVCFLVNKSRSVKIAMSRTNIRA